MDKAILRTWFKCVCGCTWFDDTNDGQSCPECCSDNWKIIDEEDVTDFYQSKIGGEQ